MTEPDLEAPVVAAAPEPPTEEPPPPPDTPAPVAAPSPLDDPTWPGDGADDGPVRRTAAQWCLGAAIMLMLPRQYWAAAGAAMLGGVLYPFEAGHESMSARASALAAVQRVWEAVAAVSVAVLASIWHLATRLAPIRARAWGAVPYAAALVAVVIACSLLWQKGPEALVRARERRFESAARRRVLTRAAILAITVAVGVAILALGAGPSQPLQEAPQPDVSV